MTISTILGLVGLLLAAGALFAHGLKTRGKDAWHDIQDAPAFSNLANEVGRAAEEGRLVHITLGSGSLLEVNAMTSLAALESITALTELSAAYDTPPIVTTADPTLYLLADDWMRRAYVRIGNVSRYRSTLVQFIAASPTTYAAMASTYLYENSVGSNLILGLFNAEVAFLGDVAARRNTSTKASTTSPVGLGALLPTVPKENLALGEEHFLGGAIATQRSAYWGALWAQDMLRWVVAGGIVITAVLTALGVGGG